VTNGPTADVFTVFANVLHRGEGGHMLSQLTAFVVDRFEIYYCEEMKLSLKFS
jgi:hypothetical protein